MSSADAGDKTRQAADTPVGEFDSTLTKEEELEILSLLRLLDLPTVKLMMLPAIADCFDEMTLDFADTKAFYRELVKALGEEVKKNPDGSLQTIGNAAPVLSLLNRIMVYLPEGYFRPGLVPSAKTLAKCEHAFNEERLATITRATTT
ncbi:MAG TPA: hypothetical protein VFO38_06640 [Candidatus Saccharimonadales bacterium]|nr:hypothetical protein [Candidatus Saccharimonadales bacterium]